MFVAERSDEPRFEFRVDVGLRNDEWQRRLVNVAGSESGCSVHKRDERLHGASAGPKLVERLLAGTGSSEHVGRSQHALVVTARAGP